MTDAWSCGRPSLMLSATYLPSRPSCCTLVTWGILRVSRHWADNHLQSMGLRGVFERPLEGSSRGNLWAIILARSFPSSCVKPFLSRNIFYTLRKTFEVDSIEGLESRWLGKCDDVVFYYDRWQFANNGRILEPYLACFFSHRCTTPRIGQAVDSAPVSFAYIASQHSYSRLICWWHFSGV